METRRPPPRIAMTSVLRATREAWRGRLPERYARPDIQREAFERLTADHLVPGAAVLDVGAGRDPTVPAARRPAGCRYVGIDLSLAELERAPAGSYDDVVVGDITRRVPELEGRFDLVLSWQVLEHVRPLAAALENIRAYLRPGGHMIVKLSGTFSGFGLANRVLPAQTGEWLLERLLRRDRGTVFPAYYDRCWYSAMAPMLRSWSSYEIVPEFFGAYYTRFSRPLTALYTAYEEWARLREHRNLATHYVVHAVR